MRQTFNVEKSFSVLSILEKQLFPAYTDRQKQTSTPSDKMKQAILLSPPDQATRDKQTFSFLQAKQFVPNPGVPSRQSLFEFVTIVLLCDTIAAPRNRVYEYLQSLPMRGQINIYISKSLTKSEQKLTCKSTCIPFL